VHDRKRDAVRFRADFRCEYCHLPESYSPLPFEIEHILPKQHGGTETMSNLALSCQHCNRHKGPNLVGVDPFSPKRKLVRLFDPRKHKWSYHFEWRGPRLESNTAIGRVTIRVLFINSPIRLQLRDALRNEGVTFD
jgi:5-methylcytosine-specific restriction endonuclease McrA